MVPAADVLDTALALAATIAGNAPLAVAATKRIALAQNESGDRPQEAVGWEMTNAALPAVAGSEDAKEGPRAFAERRAPVWQGR